MMWIGMHKRTGRATALGLLLVALAGPWTYSLDGVPPPEWCAAPHILLQVQNAERCARIVPGIEILAFMAGALIVLTIGLVLRTSAAGASEVLRALLVALIGLPVLSTSLLTWHTSSRRLQVFQIAACGLLAIAGLVLLLSADPQLPSARFWGIWLFVAVAAGAAALELATLLRRKAT